MAQSDAVRYDREIPDVLNAMGQVHTVMAGHGFDGGLLHLVLLRASQMNRCGYCVKMHTNEARRDGETSERLDRVIVWDQVADFTDREKAAFAWTEALTNLNTVADLAVLRADLRAHYSEKEISILTAAIGMINLWNRIRISGH